ncbi:hypothetical protein N9095_01260 [bacterium]|nr:hypothetical protein [bacterium]
MSSPGKFDFVEDTFERKVLEETFEIISNIAGGWEFFKNFEPPKHVGFMFSEHPILTKIGNAAEARGHGHSGASWGMTMRVMERVAKYGWEAVCK